MFDKRVTGDRRPTTEYHQVFSLEKGDRGETNLIELHIDTGDAEPRKYPVRRVPFAVREEIARNIQEMQEAGVIQPSDSPCVVLVQKRDGTLCFVSTTVV